MIIDGSKYRVIESPSAESCMVEFWNNSIVYIKLNDNIQIELEDSKNQFQLINSKYDGVNKNLILVEIEILFYF